MFVDDEPNILSTLRRLYRREGYTVLTAGRGLDPGFERQLSPRRRPRRPGRPKITRAIRNAKDIASADFFTVPTATFRLLYVFLVLDDARRWVLYFDVTRSPSAAWTGQQIVEAFPWRTAPRSLL